MRNCLLFCVFSFTSLVFLPAAERPNILYLYVDDMGWGSIGANGQAERRAAGKPSVLTPNLDRLAAEGVNFTRGYGCHVCSPARSSQQSGFHQGHTFADQNNPDNAMKALRRDDILMGDVLSAAGYTTGYWGKWGYGGSKEQKNPEILNVQTLPTSHGYTHVLAELHHVRAHTFLQPTLWSAPAKAGAKGGLELIPNTMESYMGKKSYPNEPAYQNHPDYPTPAYCDDTYAFAALDFVREQAQQFNKDGTPFFGLFAAQIPHSPFGEVAALPKWDAAYKDNPEFSSYPKQSQQWAAMVTRIDAHFGHLLDALEDPNGDGDTSDSVAANTLVVFQSDNGGPGGSNNGTFDANGGLRGSKGSIWEGGIRVPLVMRWPAQINENSTLPAGENSDRVVDCTDLLPTFCELAGVETPLGVDGVSIAPTLMSKDGQRERDYIVHEATKGQDSIIRGKDKLVMTEGKTGALSYELYDLVADHSESNDIAEEHPEMVKELAAILKAERVLEPAGFATTYHEWTGESGTDASNAGNWSDYQYENEGVVYMTDSGAPQEHWIAEIPDGGKVVVDAEVSVLALQVGGGKNGAGLIIPDGKVVKGLNEIRVRSGGVVRLDGGVLRSNRWVDVYDGLIIGHGKIVGDVYIEGGLCPRGGELEVEGVLHLDSCMLTLAPNVKEGVVLKAKKIVGSISNYVEVADRWLDGSGLQLVEGDTEIKIVKKDQ